MKREKWKKYDDILQHFKNASKIFFYKKIVQLALKFSTSRAPRYSHFSPSLHLSGLTINELMANVHPCKINACKFARVISMLRFHL
jgi:hypothetical protein